MRWVVGYEGLYLVSRTGRVLNRQGREITVRPDHWGYLRCRLTRDGKQTHKRIHRLVCEAFNGPPTAEHCAHNDGDKLNNTPQNLRWATPTANAQDALKHGVLKVGKGEASPRAKLTQAQAQEIRRRRAAGEEGKALATEFGVHPTTISNIFTGRRWPHVAATPEPHSRLRASHGIPIAGEQP